MYSILTRFVHCAQMQVPIEWLVLERAPVVPVIISCGIRLPYSPYIPPGNPT